MWCSIVRVGCGSGCASVGVGLHVRKTEEMICTLIIVMYLRYDSWSTWSRSRDEACKQEGLF